MNKGIIDRAIAILKEADETTDVAVSSKKISQAIGILETISSMLEETTPKVATPRFTAKTAVVPAIPSKEDWAEDTGDYAPFGTKDKPDKV